MSSERDHLVATNGVTVAIERDAENIRACATLRHRVFLQTYQKLGLQHWPDQPDRFDSEGVLLAARQDDLLVGTALLHHETYSGREEFWMDRFGVPVVELVPDAIGRRIGEVGRVAIDKSLTDRPLDVAAALARALGEQIALQPLDPIIGTAMSPMMLAFYQDMVTRNGGSVRIHPRKGHYAGIDMTYMIVSPDDREFC